MCLCVCRCRRRRIHNRLCILRSWFNCRKRYDIGRKSTLLYRLYWCGYRPAITLARTLPHFLLESCFNSKLSKSEVFSAYHFFAIGAHHTSKSVFTSSTSGFARSLWIYTQYTGKRFKKQISSYWLSSCSNWSIRRIGFYFGIACHRTCLWSYAIRPQRYYSSFYALFWYYQPHQTERAFFSNRAGMYVSGNWYFRICDTTFSRYWTRPQSTWCHIWKCTGKRTHTGIDGYCQSTWRHCNRYRRFIRICTWLGNV